jgi:3',5'-nucleoside bisphosphate phosphatase
MHSTASDGVYSPQEVVQIALTHNMDVIALTDHDNTSGIIPAQEAATLSKLEVFAGVELSSEDEAGDRHILGYLFDLSNAPLQAILTKLRDARVNRAERMVEKLDGLGLPISFERVRAIAGTGSVGRPHVARALVEAGHVNSLQEAFDLYLADGGPAYVPHYRLEPGHAIDLIHGAGGVAVLAHPGHYDDYQAAVEELAPLGLDGLEVFYYDHTPETVEALRVLAARHDMLMTVGSDFHRREGDASARIGSVKTPPDVKIVEAMKERAGRYRD